MDCCKPKRQVSYSFECLLHECLGLYYPGQFDLNDVLPICEACGEQIQLETPHDVIRKQYWPGSTCRKSTYLFDLDLFHFYDLLQKNNPGVSETGILKTLEHMSEEAFFELRVSRT